ncbi:tetratricopeptide repeat protein [Melioribacteraceae bacterium 4301-Me]|uniref:tetratricopeptide repeat protein n=1 Tax=Pyranulibacter aquaticus TaxID=3163344 RepID=UPI0035992B6B
MKGTIKIFVIFSYLILSFLSNNLIVAQNNVSNQQLMADFSLFYEYQKNKDYASAIPYGWKVINTDPTNFVKYKLFPKMEEALWYIHDSTKIDEAAKKKIADTLLYLYDKAIKYDSVSAGYYLAKKAFVMGNWENENPAKVIATYEEAIKKDSTLPSFYKDQLGLLYAKNATDENDYKLKALELYSKLSELEPNNELWVQRIEGLAENIEQLVDITKKAWDLDKNNLEKAWKYASICLQAKELNKALEPLEFLVSKAPKVINYWKQLANTYDKLDMNDKALQAYKTLIELQPDNRDNYVNIALVYKKIDQLAVARTYLQKAMNISPDWDYPYVIEAQLYEQAARACDFDFMAKCVYLLAVNTYKKAASLNGPFASQAAERVKALANSIPTKEDYFFRQLKSGDTIKIEGPCYSWIQRSVIVP